jgi:virginiamycin B lyase
MSRGASGRNGGRHRPRLEDLEGRFLPSITFHEFPLPAATATPTGITAGPDSNLWFTEAAANKIGRISISGSLTEFLIPTAGSAPAGIATGRDGNVWFTESAADKIGRITTFGAITEFTLPTPAAGPYQIAAGSDGNLWFTELLANKIGRITTAGVVTEFSIPATQGSPTGITPSIDGNLWFAEDGAVGTLSEIGRITTQGAVVLFPISTPGSVPWTLTSGPDGNVWFTDPGTAQIGRITAAGAVTLYPLPAGLDVPLGIAAGPDGNLWYTRGNATSPAFNGTYHIGRITTAGLPAEFRVPTPFASPQGIAAGSNGNMWFVEQEAGKVGEALLPHFLASGSDSGIPNEVKVYNIFTGALKFDFHPYDIGFAGGVRVALADVTGDGIPDIITAPGPTGGPEIKVFDGATGQQLTGPSGDFFAFSPGFLGGAYVAAGEFDGDTKADIVVGADAGGGPEVKIFSGADAHVLYDFFPYPVNFSGGVRVAVGDVNGDGQDDIITGAGPGGGPHVEVFSGKDGSLLRSFFAYAPNFAGGVYVAAGDVNDDGFADIITGAGAGGGPQVNVFSGATGAVLQSFFAYAPAFAGGVRVAAVDYNEDGHDDVMTGAGPGGGPHVQVFDGTNLAVLDGFFAFSPGFAGGVFVGGR